jgi:hypothetical protein
VPRRENWAENFADLGAHPVQTSKGSAAAFVLIGDGHALARRTAPAGLGTAGAGLASKSDRRRPRGDLGGGVPVDAPRPRWRRSRRAAAAPSPWRTAAALARAAEPGSGVAAGGRRGAWLPRQSVAPQACRRADRTPAGHPLSSRPREPASPELDTKAGRATETRRRLNRGEGALARDQRPLTRRARGSSLMRAASLACRRAPTLRWARPRSCPQP